MLLNQWESILNLFGIWVLKSCWRNKESIHFDWSWPHFKLQRKMIRFYDFYSFTFILLNWVKTFFGVVNHLDKANSTLKTKIGLTSCIETVFPVVFHFSSPFEHFCIWFYHVVFESWCNWTINRFNCCMISSVRSQEKLIAVPKLPDNFSTDDVLSFLKFKISRTDLSLSSWLRPNIPHFMTLLLQNDDSSFRIRIIWIFQWHFSFVLLINRNDVLTWGCHDHR